MGAGSVVLGMLAGVLSTLSPCVLPLLPLVVAGAGSGAGPVLLALGLAVSFTAVGLFVATVGFAAGLDANLFRWISAALLAAMGAILLSTPLQSRFALATGGIADGGHALLTRVAPSGPAGQLLVGALLGMVWSPCVGPTLGAASLLAAQGRSLPSVAAIMLAFGFGAALPLLLVATLSRRALQRLALPRFGAAGKHVFGAVALATAVLTLTGADHAFESWAVAASPGWLIDITTRF